MKYQNFCVLIIVLLALQAPLSADENDQNPPNFVILLGDDISANSVGCYGSKNPNTTPNLDQLATEGVRFTNMFVSEAICAPARAELYTGLQPYRNGCSVNHQATKRGTLSVVHHLSELGYRVGLSGKTHIKPKSVYPFEKVKGFPANCNARKLPVENWDDIKRFMTQDKEQPFCLFLCSVHAHAPWDSGDTSPWKLDELELPSHLVDTPETRAYFRQYLAEVRLFDDQVGRTRKLLNELNLDDNTVLIVLDENGAGMPCGKWTNYDWGVRSACVMKWPGNLQPSTTTAVAQYCDILPTLIDAAGGKPPESLDGKSLLPLLRGETKVHRDKAFFVYKSSGKEGLPFLSHAVTDGRFKLMWNQKPENPFTVRTINGFEYGYKDKMEDRHVRKMYQSWLKKAADDSSAQALVARFKKQPEYQLFDLDSDPEEMNNLAEAPGLADQLGELKASIVDWTNQQAGELK